MSPARDRQWEEIAIDHAGWSDTHAKGVLPIIPSEAPWVTWQTHDQTRLVLQWRWLFL